MANQTIASVGAYQIYPAFGGTDGAAPGTYLIPPNISWNGAGTPPSVTLQIPLLWTGNSSIPKPPPGNSDFSFALSASNNVQITMQGTGNMWSTAPSSRAALMSNFVSFLQNLESQLEATSTPVLIPSATFRIGQQIADNLPAPLVETLFYRYSVSPGYPAPNWRPPYVDVRPGMRLRVETETKQFVSPTSPLNVYAGTGRYTYIVGSTPNPKGTGPRQVVFDPFLGVVRTPALQGQVTQPITAAGLFDLQAVGGLQTYWRLFYPKSIAQPNTSGDTLISDNVTLIGAQSLSTLNAATQAYPNPNTTTSLPIVFLGRAVVIPEIPIVLTVSVQTNVNGQLQTASQQTSLEYVSLGTTLTQMIERFTPVPLASGQRLVTLLRPMANNAMTAGQTLPVGMPVRPITGLPSLSASLFDVPLIAGDSITLTI